MKYVKKPVVIDAVRFYDFSRGFDERPEWLKKAIYDDKKIKFFGTNGKLDIDTLEGPMFASSGDYIIRGINGEIYACKPDIFKKTYDKYND